MKEQIQSKPKCLFLLKKNFFLDIDPEFKEQLVQLVPTLLSAENLVEKEIGGAKVTCRDLLHYFKVP